jgi:hypothetical protein
VSDDQPARATGVNRPMFIGVGAYLALLGGWHVIETVPLAMRGARAEGYPDWLVPFLTVESLLVFEAGASLLVAGLLRRRKTRLSAILGLSGSSSLAIFALLYAWFLIAYENAFADGGIIWGFFHVLTLTRMPTTGTEAGVLGYKVGLGAGMVVWFAVALVSAASAVLLLRGKRNVKTVPPASDVTATLPR